MFGSFMPTFGRAVRGFGNQGFGQSQAPQNNTEAFGNVASSIGQNFGGGRNPFKGAGYRYGGGTQETSPNMGLGGGMGRFGQGGMGGFGRFGGFGGGFNPGMDKGFGPPQQGNAPFMPRLISNEDFQNQFGNMFRGQGQTPFQPQPGQDVARALGPQQLPYQSPMTGGMGNFPGRLGDMYRSGQIQTMGRPGFSGGFF